MTTERVGVELFLNSEQFNSAAKKSQAILVQNVKQTTKGFKSLNSAVQNQSEQFKQSSAEIVQAIKSISRQSNKTEKRVVSNFNKMRSASKRVSDSVFNLRSAFLGLGLGLVAKQAVQVADSYTLIDSRLRLVTKNTEEFLKVQDELFKSANETRQEFASTAQLYTRIARSSKNLTETTDELLAVTETLNKAIIVSGASVTESSAAMTQLTQGLQSGTLRGQELNSVLEQTPRIANAIADGLGVGIGELRKFGEQGKLTAQVVIDALQNQADVINEEFKGIGKTAGQSLVVLKNVINDLINDINNSTGATDGLVDVIEEFTTFITDNKDDIKEFFEKCN